MNTICNKSFVLIILAIFLINSNILYCEEDSSDVGIEASMQAKTEAGLEVDIGFGISKSFETILADSTPSGLAANFRLLVKPGKLLSLGLETGIVHISHNGRNDLQTELGVTDVKMFMNAVPILIVFSMPVWFTDITLGIGETYIWSYLEAFDVESESYIWSHCYMFAISARYEIFEDFRIGAEYKVLNIPELQANVGGFQLKISYLFLDF